MFTARFADIFILFFNCIVYTDSPFTLQISSPRFSSHADALFIVPLSRVLLCLVMSNYLGAYCYCHSLLSVLAEEVLRLLFFPLTAHFYELTSPICIRTCHFNYVQEPKSVEQYKSWLGLCHSGSVFSVHLHAIALHAAIGIQVGYLYIVVLSRQGNYVQTLSDSSI